MEELNRSFMRDAACRGLNPEMFMPVRGEMLKIKQAKAICHECPVRVPCAEYGLELSTRYDTYGIFGGFTRSERENILKQRGRMMATHRGSHLVGLTA